MTVAELIEILNKVKNKDKKIYFTDYQEWFEIDISEQENNLYIIEKG